MEILERFKGIIKNKREPFVIEIGACDGYHSNKMLEIIKEVERPFIFHAFEPNRELHQQILNNVLPHLMFNNGIIGIFPNAVGATNEETTFYKSEGRKIRNGKVVDNYYGSSSIRVPKIVKDSYPDMKFKKDKVFVTTLDRHLEKYNIKKEIHFIWIDAQGCENLIFEGAAKSLSMVDYIYTEYSNSEDYENQAVGLNNLLEFLPNFKIVEDYGGDVLLKNLDL